MSSQTTTRMNLDNAIIADFKDAHAHYWAKLEPYQDHEKLIHPGYPKKPELSQNACRFTLEALMGWFYSLTPEQIPWWEGSPTKGKWIQLFRKFMHPVQKGLVIRHPETPNEQDSIDNYLALALACYTLGDQVMADWVFKYGEKNNWVMENNDAAGPKSWLWRFPQLRYVYAIASGRDPGHLGRIVLTGSVLWGALDDSQDGKFLSWMVLRMLYPRPTFYQRWAIRYWAKKLRRVYPGGIGEVLERYYGYPTPWSEELKFVFE